MGTPRIYYYPDDDGSLETIDIGAELSDLQEIPNGYASDGRAGGVCYRSLTDDDLSVRIVFERFGEIGSSSLERKLQALQLHLHRGGLIGFSRDHAKTWAAIASTPTRADTILYTSGGNGFTAWSSAGDLAVGDEVVCEMPYPLAQREIHVVGSGGGTPRVQVSLSGSTVIRTSGGDALVRWRDFYPALYLAESQFRPIVTHDHRRNFTFDATFTYSASTAAALWETNVSPAAGVGEFTGPNLRDESYDIGAGGQSLQEILKGRGVR